MLRDIVAREWYRTPNHPKSASDSVLVSFECGHIKHYKGSQEPCARGKCEKCTAEIAKLKGE